MMTDATVARSVTPPLLLAAVAAIAVAVAYIPAFVWMWRQWQMPEGYYSHGPLIILAVGYFIALRRKELARQALGPQPLLGYPLVVLAALLHFSGVALQMFFLSAFSLPILALGCVLLLFGRPAARALMVPLLYSYFMIPLPLFLISNISFRMKLFAARASTDAMGLLGIDATLRGSTIIMPNSVLEVALPCSGLRSLIALAAFGAAFAYLSRLSTPRKWLLFLLSLPLALVANISRIVLLAWVTELYGAQAAQGWIHDASGFLLYAVACAGMAFGYALLGASGPAASESEYAAT